jgi:formylglycine-generating enzyme required for sulfatase activity
MNHCTIHQKYRLSDEHCDVMQRQESKSLIPTTIAEYSDHLFSIAEGSYAFGFDNHVHMSELVRRERPRHVVHVQQFQIAQWPISNGIWSEYIRYYSGRVEDTSADQHTSSPVTNVSWTDIMHPNDRLSFVQWCRQETGMDWQLPHEYELELFAKTYVLQGPDDNERAEVKNRISKSYRSEWCNNNYGSFPLPYPNDLVAGTEKSIRVVNGFRSTNLMDRPNTRLHAHVDYSSSDLGFRLVIRECASKS